MKKVISIFVVILLVSSLLSACDNGAHETKDTPRDAGYLYDWLTEYGTLVDGTCLQYSEKDADGNAFILCYNTNYVEKLRWHVQYTTTDASGRAINTQLFLFYEGNNVPARTTVFGADSFEDYYRTLEYFHAPAQFTHNSPISIGELDGSTVHVPDSDRALVEEILTMNTICEDNAQKNLCVILDWLKDSLCPAANMKISDLGYDKY